MESVVTTTEPHHTLNPLQKSKIKILLVDDEKDFTELLKINLEMREDYQILIENDSLKAVETAHRSHPDIIILDAMMPGIDGFDVLRHLEADPETRHIPVIFLTAISHKIDFPLFNLSEVVQRKALAKPVELTTLIEHIEEAVQSGKPN